MPASQTSSKPHTTLPENPQPLAPLAISSYNARMNQSFLDEIEAFLARTGMPARKLGHEAVNDRGFVSRLRQGRSPMLTTAEKVREYMRNHGTQN